KAAVSCSPTSAMSLSARDAPSAAKRRAIPRPMPEPAPVTRAILFARRIINDLSQKRSTLWVENDQPQFIHLLDGVTRSFTTHAAAFPPAIGHLTCTVERCIVHHHPA